MKPFLRILPCAALVFAVSCHSDPAVPGASGDDRDAKLSAEAADSPDGDTSACGSPNAKSACESVTWPRVVIAFGDPGAPTLSYVFHADDGFVSADRGPCPSAIGESSAWHCDIGFYANPAEKVVTIQVVDGDGGAILLSRDVQLMPFNYCGNGVAQVVVSVSDGGLPRLSDVQYVNACGSL